MRMMSKQIKTIEPPYEAFYVQAMLFNAESALRSIGNINAVLHSVMENSPEDPISALPNQYLLTELQNFIIQAASLSRYFWPARKVHEWRGLQLRTVFQISENNPLRSRDLRNAIEHFDEQLDHYLENGIVGYILPQYVGLSREMGEVPHHLFRAYYVDTGVFELLGKRYEVPPLGVEVVRVHKQLKKMDSSGGRLEASDT